MKYDPERPELFTGFTIVANTEERGRMELPCNPTNTTLYLHHEDYRDYDHIFRQLEGEELLPEQKEAGRNFGAFVTRLTLGEDVFEHYSEAMIQSENFPVTYRPVPDPQDRIAIESQMVQQLHNELDDIDPSDFQ